MVRLNLEMSPKQILLSFSNNM
eukprot:Gb_40219 [translate_table: standard]